MIPTEQSAVVQTKEHRVTNNTQSDDRKLLRVAEVAEILGISRSSVYRLIDRGVLVTVQFSVTGEPLTRVTNTSVLRIVGNVD